MEKKKPSTVKNSLYFLRIIWNTCPSSIFVHFIVFLEYGMWVFNSVIFMQYLFGANTENRSFGEILTFIWFATMLSIVVNIIYSWRWKNAFPKMLANLNYGLSNKLFKKAQTVDISCYENPDFYNTYTRAVGVVSRNAREFLNHFSVFFASLFAAIYVIIVMVRITPWALLFIAFPMVGNIVFGKKIGKINYDINQENTSANRKADYVNRVAFLRNYAGELRVTNIFSVLKNAFINAVDESVVNDRKHATKRFCFDMLRSVSQFVIGYEGMWLCAAILAINGTINLSQLVVLLNSIGAVSWMLRNFESSLTGLYTDSLFIENLKTFLNFEPKIDESKEGLTPPKKIETIELKNVSFKYDEKKDYVIKNVSFTLRTGVRHAFVGVNGSGKSTLIKLLLRFYDPQEGQILLNGVDIKKFDIKKYRELIGAAFQDFAIFSATVAENVMLKPIYNDDEKTIAVQALKDSDAYKKIESLANKEDSILTREFDDNGIELSGGERQKIAIARAFAKNSPVVILDEPSSALDPIAEHQMFETILRLCKQDKKLSVIVSHRMSSAAVCEKIFVFENGSLVEEGSHKELLQNNGVYALLFNKQAKNYQTEVYDAYEGL